MSEPSQDLQLATDIARDARSFLETLELVASGGAGAQAVALLLLDVAQMCVAGAHLGARTDVILDSNVEPVLETTPDLDLVRQGLATAARPGRRLRRGLRPVRRRAAGALPDVGRPRRHGPGPAARAAALRRRPRPRGAVVVAVHLPQQLGRLGRRGAARAAEHRRPRAARRRPGGAPRGGSRRRAGPSAGSGSACAAGAR